MIKRYNTRSFIFGVPGLLLQILGNGMVQVGNDPNVVGEHSPILLLGAVCALTGTALLLIGLAYYARSRGRHPAWCLLAFLSCLGLICLAFLSDKAPGGEPPEGQADSSDP
jgi:hypothetical protein